MAGLLDKVASGINKSVVTAGANSKASKERAKVHVVIENLEGERAKLAQLLGNKVYDMYKAKGEIAMDESILNFTNEIDKRLDLIAKQHEHLKQIEAELSLVTGGGGIVQAGGAQCAGCGHTNPVGAKFCAACGSPVGANA